MEFFLSRPFALAALAALCFAVTTFLMKSLANGPTIGISLLLLLCLSAAVSFEVLALRQSPLGVVYVAITAVQSLAVLTIAGLWSGGLDAQKLAGAALMLVGASVVAG